MDSKQEAARRRIEALAGGAKKRSADVRALARFAANSGCRLATLGFVARVDFDQLLVGTRLEAPYGQSPFAFRRGLRFEERLRADGHRPMLELLRDHLGYGVEGARVVNLREGFPKSWAGMAARAARTEALVREIVAGRAEAPNLLDGAVLGREVGGLKAWFEADAVAARFDGPIHAGEVKSFPTVDGQADPEKVGAAVAQVSIYILLLRELIARAGGDPAQVSSEAMLITPRNTGLRPTMTLKDVGREIDRARRILDGVPRAEEILDGLPAEVPGFGAIASRAEGPAARIAAAERLAEAVGTRYQPSCLSSCGLARMCRERAHRAGDPARVGAQLVRLLPRVGSIDRAGELARGARPYVDEQPVALELVRAERLLARYAPMGAVAGAKGGAA